MIGTSIGPYTVVDTLGAGGMGEVYRATDVKLKRQVALKVLPSGFASDPDRLARFEREAHVLASLNHPNIAAIYGLEDSSGIRALVMELVEGPTLAELMAKRAETTTGGVLSADEAWAIARQVADAIEAAHALGIVHRDLKPANIKVRGDGTVKVLDFGLAKALDAGSGTAAGDLANSPTVLSPTMLSTAGMILGTAAYMAPEQARGRPVDKRADIWAFGVVFYEMLTGVTAFPGDTVTDVLAAVLTRDPDLTRVPSRFRRLLESCLQKDPKHRLHDIGDLHLLLQDDTAASSPSRTRPNWVPWALVGVFAAISAVLTWMYVGAPIPDPPKVVQFEVGHDEKETQSGLAALSPDGTMLAYYSAGADGRYRLMLRRLDSLDQRALAGTEINLATQPPFWSHDSRYIAFWSGSTSLMKMRVPDGAPEELVTSGSRVLGGTWNESGVIVVGAAGNVLRRLQATGGGVSDLTTLDRERGDRGDSYPAFFPDGRHVLFSRRSASPERDGLWIIAIDSPDTARKLADGSAGAFAGELPDLGPAIIFLRNGSLMVQGIDRSWRALVGEPRTLLALPQGGFSVSRTGVLAYGESIAQRPGQLAWFDRQGTQLATIGPERRYHSVDLSPDGGQVSVAFGGEGTNHQLWSRDLARGTEVRVTDTRTVGGLWSSDASRLLFNSYRDGPSSVFERPANGTGADRLVLKRDRDIFVNDWSRDGRFAVYSSLVGNPLSMDLLTLELGAQPAIGVPYISEPFHQKQAQFSPNGRFVAYVSDESGRYEVYVRTFPDAAAGKWPISPDGGVEPRWSRDGTELFYWSGRKLMVATVDTTGTFSAGVARPLFEARIQANYTNDGHRWQVSPDGKRFLLITFAGVDSTPVRVVLNWPALTPSSPDAAP